MRRRAYMSGAEIYRSLASEGAINRGSTRLVRRSREVGMLQEALDGGRTGQPGGILSGEFSVRDLAENLIVNRSDGQPVGRGFIQEYFDPNDPEPLQEAMSAVDTTAFVGVQGQILVNALLQMYEQEEFVLSRAVPPTPTTLNGERIPGIARPGDPGEDMSLVREGEDFKALGFGEEYVQTPATDKHGFIIPITREAVFFDRTGMVLDRARLAGEVLGLSKEKRLIGTVIGADNTYSEKRKGDVVAQSLKTYYSATDSGRWTNHFDGNGLTDFTALDYAEQQFADITDPNTGEPINVGGLQLLAAKVKRRTIEQILTATQLYRLTTPGANQAPGLGSTAYFPGAVTIGGNWLSGAGITAMLSQQVRQQLVVRFGITAAVANEYWFFGNFSKAFAYMENWPITVVQSPVNSEAEFTADVVFRFKASERGKAAIRDPRFVQRHRALATSSSSGA
jgi:hypothetical protein